MSNPLDDYEDTRKTASIMGRMGSGFAGAMTPERVGGAAAGAALGLGLSQVGGAASKIMSAITKQRDFRRMMELSPDLVEEHSRNPSQFNQQYSSLRRLNPMFAQDPVIAGTYMRQMSLAPETAGKVLVESLGSMPKQQPMPPWAQTGMQEFGAHRSPDPDAPLKRQKLQNELDDYEQKRSPGYGQQD